MAAMMLLASLPRIFIIIYIIMSYKELLKEIPVDNITQNALMSKQKDLM